jgi:hypothetical protein
MRKLMIALVIIPALGLAGFIAFITIIGPELIFAQPHPAPTEPLAFNHQAHVEQAGMQCTFCHRTAPTSVTAGYPDVQQCMFCHQSIGQGQAEIEKVRTAWQQQQPLDWTRIHRLPDHVHFMHEPHITAGFACSTCHGDVGKMAQAAQVRPLNMGDCVSCHKVNNAPTECVTCHY